MLELTNRDRTSRGLQPLRREATLGSIAAERAGLMAAADLLTHSIGSPIGTDLAARGVTWYGIGEVIGFSTAGLGEPSADAVYRMFQGSPAHWALLMSDRFNYVGIGAAVRDANGATFVSVVFGELRDRTMPVARPVSRGRSGTTVTFRWSGSDPILQSRTAGLRDFDVQYRVDRGTWRLIRDNTTATSLSLRGRLPGHAYSVRIRARDRVGNLSGWSSPMTVLVR